MLMRTPFALPQRPARVPDTARDQPQAARRGIGGSGGPGGRDRGIDTWRAAALLRVVTYHSIGWAWLTIVFPAIGLMFALAGSLMARSLDRSGPRAVPRRVRRLLPPLWIFGAVALSVLFLFGWRDRPDSGLGWWELLWWIVPVRTPPSGGVEWSWAFTAMLWYLVAYLWLVVISAPLLVVFRRWPWQTMAASFVLPLALHFRIVSVDGYLVEPLSNVAAYGCCWLLGFAHHDGLLRRVPGRIYAAGVAGLTAISAIWLFTQGARQNDFDLNHVPPVNTLWSAAFVAAALRLDLPVARLLRFGWLSRLVDIVSARAVTIYLWHFSMLIVAQHVLGPFDRRQAPGRTAIMYAMVLVMTTIMTLLAGWVEDLAARRPPRLVPPGRRPAPPGADSSQQPPGDVPRRQIRRDGSTRRDAPPGVTVLARSRRLDPAGFAAFTVFSVLALLLGVVSEYWPATRPASSSGAQSSQGTPRYVSDLPFTAIANGLGPVERDRANGGLAVDDGGPLMLAGAPRERGLGVYAPSRVRLYPAGRCTRFRSDVGIDASGTATATVAFRVIADGREIYGSGLLTGSETRHVDIDIGAAGQIDLVVDDAGDGSVGDAADWADAALLCRP